jgi:hypothetical protein
MNVYRWVLLHTIGWSEFGLILPSLLPGILMLFLFPGLVKKAYGYWVALIFAAFLSVSPFLILYSRLARPYSMLVFLVFIAVFSAGSWILTNKKKYLLSYIFSAPLAVYFHPVAIVSIFLPLAVGGGCIVFKKYLNGKIFVPHILPSITAIAAVGVVVAGLSGLALHTGLPTIVQASGNDPHPAMGVWKEFLLMLFGTSSMPMAVALLSLCVWGAVSFFRRDFFWGTVFVLLCVLHYIMVAIGRFDCIYMPIVLARYLIVLFPICFLWTALGVEALFLAIWRGFAVRRPKAGACLISAILLLLGGVLSFTSPLKETYKAPNSFTNHSAFQESSRFQGWKQPYLSTFVPEWANYREVKMPAFYSALPSNVQSLIEYPMPLSDHCNYYYFYQHYHGKRIIAGYSYDVPFEPHPKDCVDNYYLINHVLREVEDDSQIHFRNMVNIFDPEAVRKTEAEYLIVHRNVLDEFFSVHSSFTRTPNIKNCIQRLSAQYGAPVYGDQYVLVFDIHDINGTPLK